MFRSLSNCLSARRVDLLVGPSGRRDRSRASAPSYGKTSRVHQTHGSQCYTRVNRLWHPCRGTKTTMSLSSFLMSGDQLTKRPELVDRREADVWDKYRLVQKVWALSNMSSLSSSRSAFFIADGFNDWDCGRRTGKELRWPPMVACAQLLDRHGLFWWDWGMTAGDAAPTGWTSRLRRYFLRWHQRCYQLQGLCQVRFLGRQTESKTVMRTAAKLCST